MPISAWSPVAYFWQDVLVALIVALVDRVVRRPWVTWTIYAAVVGYVALNVPIVRELSSPLTWTMMRAARGTIRDSIVHDLTAVNVGCIAIVVLTGVTLPRWLARWKPRAGVVAAGVVAGLAVVAAGPYATSQVDTRGLHRNAFGALVPTGLSAGKSSVEQDWRASPFGGESGEDLTRLSATAEGRSVLLVVLESTAAQYLKLYGAAEDPTPNLTALGEQGLVIDNAYAVYPESIKELFALLCSRYPGFDTSPEVHAQAPCASLAAVLGRAGYRSALFHSGRFAYLGMDAMVHGRGFDTVEDAGAIGGNVHSSFGVDEASAVRRILAWIDGLKSGDRFFVTYLPIAGHHPYATAAPGPFDGRTDLGQYRNALHEGDAALGDLVAGLRARGLDERTLVIALGDHGEAFGQHDGNFGHTLFIDEENVRVPMVINVGPKGPMGPMGPMGPKGSIGPNGLRVRRVASVIDVAPTILDLLGLPLERAYQGSSLLLSEARMALFFTDYSLGFLGLRDGCWKYVYQINAGRSQLYDVCRDSGERVDRSQEFDIRVRAYRDRLQAWAAETKDSVARGK